MSIIEKIKKIFKIDCPCCSDDKKDGEGKSESCGCDAPKEDKE